MGTEPVDPELADNLVRTSRTTVGDELRSVSYFTEQTVEQLYLRSDLEKMEDLVGFAENERLGFRSQAAYDQSELGEYIATIRMFGNGYLVRLIEGDHGVWVTTDHLTLERSEELATALRSLLVEDAD